MIPPAPEMRPAGAARPRISVIVNNYNYGRFLPRAIDSVLAEACPEAEIVIVDDGSTDDSRAVIAAYGDRVVAVLQANGGQAAAINAGVAAAKGEILAFLDADDWIAPGRLAAVLAAFDADPEAVLVYHRLQGAASDGALIGRPFPRSLCDGDISGRLLRTAGWWPFPLTSAVALRRSAWDALGPIPPGFRISADAWLVGVYPFVGRVKALPAALGFYRQHDNAWFRTEDDAPMLRKRMAHWKATVDATNRFLAARGRTGQLRLADHQPYHVAAARLGGVDLAERLRLVLGELRFGGEPSLLRRVRSALALGRSLPARGAGMAPQESAE